MRKMTAEAEKTLKKAAADIDGAFASGFGRWIEGSKKLSTAMAESFRSMADSMVSSLIRIGAQVLVNFALEEATGKKEQLIAAKVAASKAYKSASDLPSPLNVIVGAAEAAAVFAAAMSFEKGGIVPQTGMAMVHAGERVLTQQQTSRFEQVLASNTSNSNVNNHYHGYPGESPNSVTRNTAAWQRAHRDGRLRFA
jgi:hypothetical protein